MATPVVRIALSALAPQVISPTRAVRLLDRRRGVGGAEDLGLLALPLDRVDGDDVAGAGHGRALHGVHADAAEADDHDGLAGAGRRRRRSAAPQPVVTPQPTSAALSSGMSVVDLDAASPR